METHTKRIHNIYVAVRLIALKSKKLTEIATMMKEKRIWEVANFAKRSIKLRAFYVNE